MSRRDVSPEELEAAAARDPEVQRLRRELAAREPGDVEHQRNRAAEADSHSRAESALAAARDRLVVLDSHRAEIGDRLANGEDIAIAADHQAEFAATQTAIALIDEAIARKRVTLRELSEGLRRHAEVTGDVRANLDRRLNQLRDELSRKGE